MKLYYRTIYMIKCKTKKGNIFSSLTTIYFCICIQHFSLGEIYLLFTRCVFYLKTTIHISKARRSRHTRFSYCIFFNYKSGLP